MEGSINIHIIAAYAPTADALDKDKEAFYVTLSQTRQTLPKQDVQITGGDFNAKLIWAPDDDATPMGKHFLRANTSTFETTAQTTLDNRNNFIEYITDNGQHICNTHFEKPEQNKCTHLPIGHVRTEDNWNYNNFEQIDYILFNDR